MKKAIIKLAIEVTLDEDDEPCDIGEVREAIMEEIEGGTYYVHGQGNDEESGYSVETVQIID